MGGFVLFDFLVQSPAPVDLAQESNILREAETLRTFFFFFKLLVISYMHIKILSHFPPSLFFHSHLVQVFLLPHGSASCPQVCFRA